MVEEQNNKQKVYRDVDDTIQFTQQELQKLRTPNRQPIDGDYFSTHESKKPKQKVSYEAVAHKDVTKTLKERINEPNNEENPFTYQSKSAEYRKKFEDKKAAEIEKAKAYRNKILSKFEDTYEAVYDENNVTDFSKYNQFSSEKDDEDVEMTRVDRLAKQKESKSLNKINVSQKMSGWADKVKNNVAQWKTKKSSATLEDDTLIDSPEAVDNNPEKDMIDSVEVEPIVQTETVEKTAVQPNKQTEMVEEVTVAQAPTVLTEEVTEVVTDVELNETLVNESLQLNETSDADSFVKGTAWLTAGNIISRILGALYVIPWGTWFGTSYTTANVLFGIGYNPYALFLAISTGGFPSAIAKQMAYYHSKKQYQTADKLFKNSLVVMGISGILSGGLLFLLAPFIANISSTDNPSAAIVVIRSLAPALLILPIMSLLRGYFQGFGDMIPTAVSQILEQIARVIYMLAATFAVMKLLTGDVTTAVAHSTFAAFIGALVSLIYLVILYLTRRKSFKQLVLENEAVEEEVSLDFKTSLFILFKDSIPFILLGSGIIIAKFIDQITFKWILESTTTLLLSEISELFGVLNLDVDKLIMIIISIAVGMSLSSIPLITKLYANNHKYETAALIEKISMMFLLIMLPAAVGLASIANNAYQMFYPFGHEQGPELLVTASILSVILGAYTVLSTIFQSMSYRRLSIKYLLWGLLAKVILQFPLVALMQAHGAIIATLIAFLITSVLIILKLHQLVHFDFLGMLPDTILIIAATLVMGLSASFWNLSLDALFGPVGRWLTFVKILIIILFSALTYFGILALFGKLSLLFGDKKATLQEKLRLF